MAKSEGTATITIYAAGGSEVIAQCTVTVMPKEPTLVQDVAFENKNIELVAGESTTPTLIFTPENASNKNVTWSSSNEEVATVDKNNGLISANKSGTATITVTTTDGSDKTATCEVTVKDIGFTLDYNKKRIRS